MHNLKIAWAVPPPSYSNPLHCIATGMKSGVSANPQPPLSVAVINIYEVSARGLENSKQRISPPKAGYDFWKSIIFSKNVKNTCAA